MYHNYFFVGVFKMYPTYSITLSCVARVFFAADAPRFNYAPSRVVFIRYNVTLLFEGSGSFKKTEKIENCITVSGSFPAFFLPIATTSNKNF